MQNAEVDEKGCFYAKVDFLGDVDYAQICIIWGVDGVPTCIKYL